MDVHFVSLASGSRANSSLVLGPGGGILVDLGLGARSLQERLSEAGYGLSTVRAAVLSHTHGDHVQDSTLRLLAREGIRLYCHAGHGAALRGRAGFELLAERRLVTEFEEEPFLTHGGARVEPLPVTHDGGPTFGFRIEDGGLRSGPRATVAIVTDTGSWTQALADALADVDLLGLEFNHDEHMQRNSGRVPFLIARNLDGAGHLSNAQAAALLVEVLRRSRRRAPKHLVLMHMSQECNRVELALESARQAIRRVGKRVHVHASSSEYVTPRIRLGHGAAAVSRGPRKQLIGSGACPIIF
jgi:phosphoribosyl 1,2-cyclic phosphodiesterase